jgi:hypothetical protein
MILPDDATPKPDGIFGKDRVKGRSIPRPVQTDEETLIAIHEAAHAVTARLLGHEVIHARLSAPLSGVSTNHCGDRRAHLRELAIALAGPLAEHYYRPTTRLERSTLWRMAWRIDLANIRRNIIAAGGADVRVVAVKVAALVDKHWSAILRVARALHGPAPRSTRC